MNCSDKVTLQEYLDNELDVQESARLDSHLKTCEKCRELLAEVKSDRDQVMEFLTGLYSKKNPISVPSPPVVPQGKDKGRKAIPQWLRAAAGIALIIGLFWIVKTEIKPKTINMDEAELLFLEMIGDNEPNKSWHNHQSLIIFSDENGQVIQSFINDN